MSKFLKIFLIISIFLSCFCINNVFAANTTQNTHTHNKTNT